MNGAGFQNLLPKILIRIRTAIGDELAAILERDDGRRGNQHLLRPSRVLILTPLWAELIMG